MNGYLKQAVCFALVSDYIVVLIFIVFVNWGYFVGSLSLYFHLSITTDVNVQQLITVVLLPVYYIYPVILRPVGEWQWFPAPLPRYIFGLFGDSRAFLPETHPPLGNLATMSVYK